MYHTLITISIIFSVCFLIMFYVTNDCITSQRQCHNCVLFKINDWPQGTVIKFFILLYTLGFSHIGNLFLNYIIIWVTCVIKYLFKHPRWDTWWSGKAFLCHRVVSLPLTQILVQCPTACISCPQLPLSAFKPTIWLCQLVRSVLCDRADNQIHGGSIIVLCVIRFWRPTFKTH